MFMEVKQFEEVIVSFAEDNKQGLVGEYEE